MEEGITQAKNIQDGERLIPKLKFLQACDKMLKNEQPLLVGIVGTKYSLVNTHYDKSKYKFYIIKVELNNNNQVFCFMILIFP